MHVGMLKNVEKEQRLAFEKGCLSTCGLGIDQDLIIK
jgi:hypothetical protein